MTPNLAFTVPTLAGAAMIPPFLPPGEDWDGTADSGFTSTPSDPTRTTAKPIVRLIDPPNQYFTDGLTVSVMAFANDGGTLIGGIEKVTFHFEGQTVDVAAPTLRQFTRYDGTTYRLPCYTVRLRKPVGTSGLANLYVEAVPSDSAMQSRVLGPYQFGLATTKHDWEKTIGPSGADYTTIAAAIAAAKTASVNNPRVTFIASGTYDMGGGTPNYTPEGYMTFECATGVNITIAKSSYTTDTAMLMRTRWDGLWFRGSGFTFDFAVVDQINNEAQSAGGAKFTGRSHVLEGVKFTRSSGSGALIRKGIAGGTTYFSVQGSPWFLECKIENMQTPGEVASIYRGCVFEAGFQDVAYGAACVVGCRVDGWDSIAYRTLVSAMTVTYAGAGTTADLSLTGASDASTRTFTARVDGSSVGTFAVQNSEAAFTAGTNYNVSNVVTWLNGLSGWSATLVDDTRRATVLTTGAAGFGAFTNVNCKSVTLSLSTAFDLHTDFYQKDGTNLVENVLIYGNSGTDIDAQFIMIGGNESRDWAVINNALDVLVPSGDNPSGNVLSSQMGHPQKHVILAHNSFPQQSIGLRDGASSVQQYNADGYCLVACNSVRNIRPDTTLDPDVVVLRNHLHSGQSAAVPGTGGSTGGDQTTLYADFDAGDFTPAGELLTNLKVPVWTYDLAGQQRGATAPAGALA